ncbi:UDP-glycosyltransferase family 35 member B1 [Carabus blaptoides fortunei]
MKVVSTVLGIFLVCCVTCDGARILGVFPIPSPSHNILGTRLMQELAHRGHEVTMVSPFPQKESKNYKGVLLTGFVEKHKEILDNVFEQNKGNFIQNIPRFSKVLTMYSEATFNHTNFHNLLNSNETFDLIIIEAMFNEAHVGIGYYYSAPVIILSTVGSNWMVNKYVANPAPASMVPDTFLGFPPRMNFVQRLLNTLGTGLMDLFHQFYHLRVQNDLLHEYFPHAPHLQDVIREHVSLLFLNADPSFDGAKPLMPNMVHIAADLGIGTTLAFDDITVDTFADAIREVVNNKMYKLQARRRSSLIRDLPQRPLDTAMFWVEYVLRHRNISHLKSPAIYLEWYQINMLDIYATLAAGVILVSALSCLVVKKLCCSKKTEKKDQQDLKKKKRN